MRSWLTEWFFRCEEMVLRRFLMEITGENDCEIFGSLSLSAHKYRDG
jgi:hypothetical protein